MEIKQNKFLMVFASSVLLFTVFFFTYIIFKSNEGKNDKTQIKEELKISVSGSVDNVITINSTLWDSSTSADNNPNISKIDFLVDTTNSTTTNATYNLFLDLIEMNKIENLNNVKWKLYNKKNWEKEVMEGDFSSYNKDQNKINISRIINIPYGGNIDNYKLYIYLNKTDKTNNEENISFKAKLLVETNK